MRVREIVHLNKMPLANRGCRLTRIACAVCGGAGAVARRRNKFRIGICRVCGGHGFQMEWRQAPPRQQQPLF